MTTPADFGPLPEFAMLPVAELHVDSSYQRSIEARRNQAAIERICEGFRWSLFGVVTVTKGLAGYLIIDGQHRTEAARRRKVTSVPCLVVPPLSRQEQALAFVAANRDRVNVTPFAIHRAMAAAGNVDAVALDAMCRAADVEIPAYPIPAAFMKPQQTLAIGALTAMLQSRGHDRAAALLRAVRLAFPDERGALRAPLISALVMMDEAAMVDAAAVQRALAKCGLKAFEKACAAQIVKGENSKTRTQAVVAVLSRLIGRTAAPAAALPTITPSVKATPRPAAPPPVKIASPAPKPRKPIPVSDGRARPKAGPSREEIDKAIGKFVATKGITQCPPAAVAATTADPGSKFSHEVLTEAQRRAREAGESGNKRQGRGTV